MAMLFMDGFDHYASADIPKKWNSAVSASRTILPTGGRRGGGALQLSATGCTKGFAAAATDTIVVGVCFVSSSDTPTIQLTADATGTIHLTVRVLANGAVEALRGTTAGTIIGTSAAGAVPNRATTFYIEVKAKLHDTTGSVEVRVNGSSTPVLNLTNVDTKSGGTETVFSGITLSTQSSVLDDLYVLDTSGAANNNFLGDVRIDTIFPTSDGNYQSFTPSTAGAHYVLVDDATPNTTDYVDGAASGDRESFGLADLAALTSSTVYAVQVNAAVNKDDAGARSASTMIRTSATDADGASVALGTTQSYISQIYATDAGGSAWTQSSVNAMEAGVRVSA